MRSLSVFVTIALAASAAFTFSACNKEESHSVQTDSTYRATTSSTVNPSDSSAKPAGSTGSVSNVTPGSGVPSSPGAPSQPGPVAGSTPQSGDTSGIVVGTVDPNNPIAKQLLEQLRQKDNKNAFPPPTIGLKIVHATEMATLMPNFPGYRMASRAIPFESQGHAQALAQFKSLQDSTRSIRVIISDVNELGSSPYATQLSALERSGQLTDNSQGEAITAYYVKVNGVPAAKTYIPSKKVATLTLFVSDHRVMQLREDKVTSADHLLEMARYLDIKKFQSIP